MGPAGVPSVPSTKSGFAVPLAVVGAEKRMKVSIVPV
jgi:hypothetical protein